MFVYCAAWLKNCLLLLLSNAMKGAFITICLQVKGENGDKWVNCTLMNRMFWSWKQTFMGPNCPCFGQSWGFLKMSGLHLVLLLQIYYCNYLWVNKKNTEKPSLSRVRPYVVSFRNMFIWKGNLTNKLLALDFGSEVTSFSSMWSPFVFLSDSIQ